MAQALRSPETGAERNGIWVLRLSWLVWVAFALVLCIKIFRCGAERSVYPLFLQGGRHWLEGLDTYSGACLHFQYWPGFAAFMALFAFLPFLLGSLLWSALNLGLFLHATTLFAREYLPHNPLAAGLFRLALLPLALEGLLNQQSNPLLISLAVYGAVFAARGRWNLAAFFLLLPGITKIAPMCFGLLLLLVFPKKLGWRLPVFGLLLLGLPLALQQTDYVLREYGWWLDTLRSEEGARWAYRDAWILWELFTRGVVSNHEQVLGMEFYRLLQAGMAGGAALWCLWVRYKEGLGDRAAAALAFAAGGWWILLWGPSTEVATMVVVAPAAAWALTAGWAAERGRWLAAAAFLFCALGALGDVEWELHRLTGSDWPKAFLPVGGILLGAWLLLRGRAAAINACKNRPVQI